ncbi:hypothetical protein ACET3Z_006178 [Daucus carota]
MENDTNSDEQTDGSVRVPMPGDGPNASTASNAVASELFLREPYEGPAKNDYFNKGRVLYKAARNGKWKDVQGICNGNEGRRAFITAGHETALHISALAGNVEFVEELLKDLIPEDLQIINKKGNTALVLAAANGNVEIAEKLIDKSPGLQDFIGTGSDGTAASLPVMMAARLGNGRMVEALRGRTQLTNELKGELMKECIDSDLFDSARKILGKHKRLAVSDPSILEKLATKPMAEATEKRIWETFFCWGRKQEDSRHIQALELLKDILKLVFTENDFNIQSVVSIAGRLLFDAAEQGNFHFVKWLIYYYPEIVWKMDTDHLSMFHVAVKFRHERIFSLLYNMDEVRKLVTTYQEKDTNNNMLHLAATLAPKDKLDSVIGAAFQMQRAICWYKAVEKIVPPAYRNMPNETVDDETDDAPKRPADIFDKQHEKLLEDGEKWMKNTAKSCMVVAALTATVMFSSAFTVRTWGLQ